MLLSAAWVSARARVSHKSPGVPFERETECSARVRLEQVVRQRDELGRLDRFPGAVVRASLGLAAELGEFLNVAHGREGDVAKGWHVAAGEIRALFRARLLQVETGVVEGRGRVVARAKVVVDAEGLPRAEGDHAWVVRRLAHLRDDLGELGVRARRVHDLPLEVSLVTIRESGKVAYLWLVRLLELDLLLRTVAATYARQLARRSRPGQTVPLIDLSEHRRDVVIQAFEFTRRRELVVVLVGALSLLVALCGGWIALGTLTPALAFALARELHAALELELMRVKPGERGFDIVLCDPVGLVGALLPGERLDSGAFVGARVLEPRERAADQRQRLALVSLS